MANGNGSNGNHHSKKGREANLARAEAIKATKKPLFIESYRRTGLIGKSAVAIGSTRTTVNIWRKEDPAFEAECVQALKDYCERIEREIHRRAITGVRKPIFYQGQECGEVREYSDRMLELLAKRHMPEYRERQQIDMNVRGGVLAVPGMAKDTRAWEEEQQGVAGNRNN